jgi:beta-galactosidase
MFRCMFVSLVTVTVASASFAQNSAPSTVDLSGIWRFALDRSDAGLDARWFVEQLPGSDTIKIPGILQAQGYGDEISVDTPWVAALPRDMRWNTLPQYAPYTRAGNVKMPYLAQPPKHYLGVAWYQRDIDIPQSDNGKCEHLFLERPHWGSIVWLDEQQVGTCNSLVAPHEFDLGIVAPGKHRLTVRLDNRMSVVPGYRPDGHSVSDALGATWNGMVGRIEMRATTPVFVDDVQVFPDVQQKKAIVKIHIGNHTGAAGKGTILAREAHADLAAGKARDVSWDEKGGDFQTEVDLPPDPQPWDEFHPVLQHISIVLNSSAGSDERTVSFGLSQISHSGDKLLLNGKEINLRMTHSGGDFPLTGYPATDVAAWKKIIQTCKDYGLNGMRFHSWCPPEAAFQAGDELGFYFQVEAGMWNSFNPAMVAMLNAETERMERNYGNHPSFILLSPSNEPAGSYAALLPAWAARWNTEDPRRLYCGGTGRTGRSPEYGFAVFAWRGPMGWFGRDYGGGRLASDIPTIAHEVGQWCVYPDFDVIRKFTGYLRPGDYEIWRDFAALHGVLNQNKRLAWASGRFSAECYKQEIEANLRTRGLSGFELLDLHDDLEQGGSLVGMLDAFWESKNFISADEFRRFCAPVVPLARMHNYIYRSDDVFDIPVEIANYSAGPISNITTYWKIVDLGGKVYLQGTLAAGDLPIGKNLRLGNVTADLSTLKAPNEYKLVVGLTGTKTENDWKFWLYPTQLTESETADVLITTDWNSAKARLADGGKVIFTPSPSMLDDSCPPMASRPIFWNRVMNNTNPKGLSAVGFLGLLVDSKHPALSEFPSEDYCDWQWTDITNGVHAINLESVPSQLTPMVQAIDDWNRGFKLAVIFECNVNKGKLLVSAIDLQGNSKSSVARQLCHSLVNYANSDKFAPKVTLSADQADALWPATRPLGYKAPPMPVMSAVPGANPGDLNVPTGDGPTPR